MISLWLFAFKMLWHMKRSNLANIQSCHKGKKRPPHTFIFTQVIYITINEFSQFSYFGKCIVPVIDSRSGGIFPFAVDQLFSDRRDYSLLLLGWFPSLEKIPSKQIVGSGSICFLLFHWPFDKPPPKRS